VGSWWRCRQEAKATAPATVGEGGTGAPQSTTCGKRQERRPGRRMRGGGGTPGRGAPAGGPSMAVPLSLGLAPSCNANGSTASSDGVRKHRERRVGMGTE
jgi:hypothetical protein